MISAGVSAWNLRFATSMKAAGTATRCNITTFFRCLVVAIESLRVRDDGRPKQSTNCAQKAGRGP